MCFGLFWLVVSLQCAVEICRWVLYARVWLKQHNFCGAGCRRSLHVCHCSPMRSCPTLPCAVQAAGVLPAGTLVSALVLGDLGAMPVPEVPAATQLPG